MTGTVTSVQRTEILDALHWVVDPEIGLDIVALGLVYDIAIAGGDVRFTMTMTTRGCPLHDAITTAISDAVSWLGGVEAVVVELVWDPPWHPAMIGWTPGV